MNSRLLERAECFMELIVQGQPAGAGSKTAQTVGARGKERRDRDGRIVLIYRPSSPATAPWMEKVEEAAREQLVDRGLDDLPSLDGALWLDVAFYELRPAAHFLADGRLNPRAPALPHQTSTHDRDKMVRAVSDSLTRAKVIADDKRLVCGPSWKFYADEPPRKACAVIRLGRMLHQTVEEAEIKSPPPPGQETLA